LHRLTHQITGDARATPLRTRLSPILAGIFSFYACSP
jgi:hypothetical protein